MNVLMMALAAGVAFVAQADDLDKIKSKGEIVIGVRDSAPPPLVSSIRRRAPYRVTTLNSPSTSRARSA
ncbi:hypothetical protein [Chitinimonas sp. BJB300]|uniref:hypothetical protein n=1 Tax=Chitinimonas sp. BJB300 TaxID=1559339 RepID=UPI000C102E99|nr:hypothetical protein [Chitinimonas sp. BJB300]PHV12438.1 hypothetical protein CSQ89_05610 [Chitinimonas sp. BJB300]TSJ88560.1 hypothetical protein FG002_010355 [Chitinimonas sp. BJB300]